MVQGINTFLPVLAAIFPVVNPPGTALVFLALTRGAEPALRRAGGYIVAVAGWRLLHEGSHKDVEALSDEQGPRGNLLDQAFYPLTLPLTTGPAQSRW